MEPARRGAARDGTYDRDAIERADELDDLAEAEAAGRVDSPTLTRSRTAHASSVFSVRLPHEAARILSDRAAQQGVSPGVLLRSWAMDELVGDSGRHTLTFGQAEDEFRQALDRVASRALRDAATAAAGAVVTVAGAGAAGASNLPTGVNLGPRRVHERLRDRRAPA